MMEALVVCLFFYLLGGLTFVPLVLLGFFIHAYITLPIQRSSGSDQTIGTAIVQRGDDTDVIKEEQKRLEGKTRTRSHESDVAAGYFAVCREYVPGGVNGKPPERSSPSGSTTISASSPSVYQSIYRNIFDRKQANSPLDNKAAGKPQKRGGNVFYVVLRHGHLVLFDDDDQIEVRHVISLHHHTVSIYSGGDETPEGELFIKRNAICLSRCAVSANMIPDSTESKPFFLFSDNCSDKEDFYFTLLRNQANIRDLEDKPPTPLQYDVKDVITLVQRLHSSEEHLQTRWINAIIGRIFLALYKTSEVENFIRAKISKKISRVKTPAFLSKIVLRHIDMGAAAPVITNPRLKDLTVDGELVVEADVRYAGNFRIEVATTARIELGTRFKAREVNLLLAVVVKRLEGHALLRVKPPPSNRIWTSFQTMPKIDMSIEPIVSSRQITYTLILRQIENRIKEVIAESLVLPNWDDMPFYHSESKAWRGGIWEDEAVDATKEEEAATTSEDTTVELNTNTIVEQDQPMVALPQVEKGISMPMFDTKSASSVSSQKGDKLASSALARAGATSSGVEVKSNSNEKLRALRKSSFASSPIVGTDITNVDAIKNILSENSHATAVSAMSALSHASSPSETPLLPTQKEHRGSCSSRSSNASEQGKALPPEIPPKMSSNAPNSTDEPTPPSPTAPASQAPSAPSESHSSSSRRESPIAASSKSAITESKKLSLAAVTSAAAANARKWGLTVLQRHGDTKSNTSSETETSIPPLVMGRGRPLPPPGTPLPGPGKKTKTTPMSMPKRKPIPSPVSQGRRFDIDSAEEPEPKMHQPPLPRRRVHADSGEDEVSDSVLVVSVPTDDSKSSSPGSQVGSFNSPWTEEYATEDTLEQPEQVEADLHAEDSLHPKSAHVPKRTIPPRTFSTSPEEDGPHLPSWLTAQEEEARSRRLLDEDTGV